MAITEERLEQLIKQEKDVFILCDNDFIRKENTVQYNFRIDENVDFGEYIILSTDEYGTTLRYRLTDVFETEKEAEFVAKYQNIQKIVSLDTPPMYEIFLDMGWYRVSQYSKYVIYIYDKNICIDDDDKECVFRLPNTEENYYKCLDKLVELWRKE